MAPKVASFSIRQWLWELGTGASWQGGNIWDTFSGRGMCRSIFALPKVGELRIAVHRSGPDRIRAIYDHIIVTQNGWKKCTIEEFAWNLAAACVESPNIAHHCCPQWHWLGGDPRYFDIILPFSELHRLPSIAAIHLGRETPKLPHCHRTPCKSEVSEEALALFAAWSAYDTTIGWDGNTMILPKRFVVG